MIIPRRLIRRSQLRPREGGDNHFSALYGAYHHQYLTVSYGEMGSEDFFDMFSPSRVEGFRRSNPEVEVQVDMAIAMATGLHEFRHFHDCFGTYAGLSLFLDHMTLVDNFLDACSALGRRGLTWKLPLSDWIQSADCPDEVKLFATTYRSGKLFRMAFVGSFGLPEEPGSNRDIAGEFVLELPRGQRLEFIAYPNNYGVSDPATKAPSYRVSWRPVGFEALLEGNAQALQRTTIEALWGPTVAARVWDRMTRVAVPQVERHRPAAELFGPYNVTDFLLTRFLETKGITQFDRQLVLDITDAALMDSGLLSMPTSETGQIGKIYRNPGKAFLQILDQIKWQPGTQPASAAAPSAPIGGTNQIDRMQQLIDHIPTTDMLFSSDEFVRPTDAMRSYIAHSVVRPMLELRKQHGDGILRNHMTYLSSLARFPVPPVAVVKNGFLAAVDFSDKLQRKRLDFILMERIMAAIAELPSASTPIIFCPRAMRDFPGAAYFELEPTRGCETHIKRMACRCWTPGQLDDLPPCGFRTALAALRVENPLR